MCQCADENLGTGHTQSGTRYVEVTMMCHSKWVTFWDPRGFYLGRGFHGRLVSFRDKLLRHGACLVLSPSLGKVLVGVPQQPIPHQNLVEYTPRSQDRNSSKHFGKLWKIFIQTAALHNQPQIDVQEINHSMPAMAGNSQVADSI